MGEQLVVIISQPTGSRIVTFYIPDGKPCTYYNFFLDDYHLFSGIINKDKKLKIAIHKLPSSLRRFVEIDHQFNCFARFVDPGIMAEE